MSQMSITFRSAKILSFYVCIFCIFLSILELPGPPEQLTTSLIGMNAVALRWRPPKNADVTGYIIQTKEGDNGNWVKATVLKSDVHDQRLAFQEYVLFCCCC